MITVAYTVRKACHIESLAFMVTENTSLKKYAKRDDIIYSFNLSNDNTTETEKYFSIVIQCLPHLSTAMNR